MCLPRSVCGPGCLLTPGSAEGTRVRLLVLPLLPRRPPAVGSHGRPAPAATPPLQCSVALVSCWSLASPMGAPRGPAAEWSSAAVRARSQEPAARSLALARPPARLLLFEFKVTIPSALSTPRSGAALRGSGRRSPSAGGSWWVGWGSQFRPRDRRLVDV